MVTLASRPAWDLRGRALSERVAVPLVLGALVAVSLLIRTQSFDVGFWIDEGLSVGIADRPLLDIPGALRQDGSPPLYYMLVHVWIGLVGRSEADMHTLSLLFALLAIPAAWWAARGLFGPRAGWIAAALTAVNPYLTQYAQEARMYSLVILLGIATCAGYAQVFALRRRSALPLFAVALAALLYTHNWAVFFVAGAGLGWLALVGLARGPERRALVRDGLIGFGAALVLYLPWLPSLLFQSAHTGAPWARTPPLDSLFDAFGLLLGTSAVYLLVLTAGAGLLALVRTRQAEWMTPQGRAAVALFVAAVATLVLAWSASQASPAWALRYLAVALPPLLLLAAAGLARSGRLGLAALAVVCVLWAFDDPPDDKSNVRDVTAEIAPSLRPGDLVVSTQPEQIPVLAYYLPDGLRYATLWGPVRDLGVTDWRDGVDRLKATSPERNLAPLLDQLQPGRRLVLIEPTVYDRKRWSAPWTELVRVRSLAWSQFVSNDRRFRVSAIQPASSNPPRPNPVKATVLIKDPMR